VKYVEVPRKVDIAGFAPQWFSEFDLKEPVPIPDPIADWFKYRQYILQEAKEDAQGIVSSREQNSKTGQCASRM